MADILLKPPVITVRGHYRIAAQLTVRVHGLGRMPDSDELCVITQVNYPDDTRFYAVTLPLLERRIASATRLMDATRRMPDAPIRLFTQNKLGLFVGLKNFLEKSSRNRLPTIRYQVDGDDVVRPVGLTASYRDPLELVKKLDC